MNLSTIKRKVRVFYPRANCAMLTTGYYIIEDHPLLTDTGGYSSISEELAWKAAQDLLDEQITTYQNIQENDDDPNLSQSKT